MGAGAGVAFAPPSPPSAGAVASAQAPANHSITGAHFAALRRDAADAPAPRPAASSACAEGPAHFALVDTAHFGYASLSDDELDQPPPAIHALDHDFETDLVGLAAGQDGAERRGVKRQAAFEPPDDDARARGARERRQLLHAAGLQRMAAGVPLHICGHAVGYTAEDSHWEQQLQQQQQHQDCLMEQLCVRGCSHSQARRAS